MDRGGYDIYDIPGSLGPICNTGPHNCLYQWLDDKWNNRYESMRQRLGAVMLWRDGKMQRNSIWQSLPVDAQDLIAEYI